MEYPSGCYLDGDIIAYKVAFWVETNDPSLIPKKTKELVVKWSKFNKPLSEVCIALSCSREDNFRRDIWPNYKVNRTDSYVPEYLKDVKDHIQEKYMVDTVDKLEADDILGIHAMDKIAITIDKDLIGCEGWHFNPDKDNKPRYVTAEAAYRFFCKQWMMGDATDCIPGLWRVGPKKADKLLDEWPQDEWEDRIFEMYDEEKYQVKDPCNLSPKEVALAMARCVKILDHNSWDYDTYEHTLWTPKSGS